ncbi:MAG: CesT family type III secretion system chaperone [Chlamydiota bacterium]
MNFFQELVWDLGEMMKIPFHIDENNACRLLIGEKLPIQLEMDDMGENVLVAASVSEIPPGRFREDLLKAALKANAPYNPHGALAYVEKKNILVLYKFLAISQCTAPKLVEFLVPFIEYAESWQASVLSGIPPSPSQHTNKRDLPPPFSIR